MFTRIQARHFRSLKAIDQPLGRFAALIGPNASGKTTFLDLFSLLSDLMRSRGDVPEAVYKRSADFTKLLWKGEGSSFQIAVEARIPEDVRLRMAKAKQNYCVARYEIEIGIDERSNEIGLNHETLSLTTNNLATASSAHRRFPAARAAENNLLLTEGHRRRILIERKMGGDAGYYFTEGPKNSKSANLFTRLGRTTNALANVPPDQETFPVSLWFQKLLEDGVQNFVLDSQVIRHPSPPGLGLRFKPDGSNLPWMIYELSKDRKRFSAWLEHVTTALDDIRKISTIERSEDRHRYLVIDYANGARVPSWLVSAGTLRLLALTILAYLKDMKGVYLIEEPENGIHPKAMETVIQSLTSIYDGQVLITTHSPGVVGQLELGQLLCFAKDEEGASDIVSGNLHPRLSEWKRGQPDLSVLFASGVLS